MSGSYERGNSLSGAQRFEVDTVIVGSGASGSVVACQLAEAGERVMVLEEGKHIPHSEYGKMRPTESMRHLWREGGMSAALGVGDTPVINVTMGRVVGGSSVLTGGVCFRTPGFVHDVWVKERGLTDLTEAALEPYFEEVEKDVHVETVPVDMRSRSTHLFGEGARKLGFEIKPTRRNTKGCKGCGRCNFGCPEGAKMSVDLTYLPRAVNAGATVLSDCLIDRVLTNGSRAIGVSGRLLNRPGHKPGDQVEVLAKRVVLAAGAAHTPLILMRSGIGRRSKQVGRNMTLHPSFRMVARFDETVRGWSGAMQSAFSDEFEHDRVTMVSVFLPPGTVATGIPGFGPEFADRARGLDHLAMFGGLVHDDGGGRVRRNPFAREPLMTYRMAKEDRRAVSVAIRKLGETFLAAGAKELYLPILGFHPVDADAFRKLDLDAFPGRRIECASQHPLGTTRMGSEPKNSVVDSNGKVWDVDQLFVVDGGVVPTSLGVNPQLTIMTMALRLARGMLDA